MFLPDINVWLSLTFDSRVHHSVAKAWFDALADDAVCFFCRLTQQGFLRLATNVKVFGPDALTLDAAWRSYDQFLSDPRIAYAQELPLVESHWRAFTQAQSFSPHVWNDAYLAAFALAAGWELVTFDRALAVYRNVNCRVLS